MAVSSGASRSAHFFLTVWLTSNLHVRAFFLVFLHNVAFVLEFRLNHTIAVTSLSDAPPIITD